MKKSFEKVTSDIANSDLAKYWPDFKLAAYALYDKENVYLFNHPKFAKTGQRLKWDERFMGETIILYEDYPTAIVNLEFHEDAASLFSILVHEMFHGHQYLNDQLLSINEMLGVTYPLSKENVELRTQERKMLYQAVMAASGEEKRTTLQHFFALREVRKNLIGEHLQYENLIETIEGPAWYVEMKAYSDKGSMQDDHILRKYCGNLIDQSDSFLHIRKSCYSSGLALCLLLDEISSSWKESFFKSGQSLYDFFKGLMEPEIMPIGDLIISNETEKVIAEVGESREYEFKKFSSLEGFHLYIEGDMKSTLIDPMNIIPGENKRLHKNFIKIKLANREFLFQQPVITYMDVEQKRITRLLMVLNEKPIVKNGSIIVKGIGEIPGQYIEKADMHYLICE